MNGAWRSSIAASSTQYSAMNTGICTTIGKQPPSGLIFSVLYSSIIAWFMLLRGRCRTSRGSSCIRGVISFIFAIDL